VNEDRRERREQVFIFHLPKNTQHARFQNMTAETSLPRGYSLETVGGDGLILGLARKVVCAACIRLCFWCCVRSPGWRSSQQRAVWCAYRGAADWNMEHAEYVHRYISPYGVHRSECKQPLSQLEGRDRSVATENLKV